MTTNFGAANVQRRLCRRLSRRGASRRRISRRSARSRRRTCSTPTTRCSRARCCGRRSIGCHEDLERQRARRRVPARRRSRGPDGTTTATRTSTAPDNAAATCGRPRGAIRLTAPSEGLARASIGIGEYWAAQLDGPRQSSAGPAGSRCCCTKRCTRSSSASTRSGARSTITYGMDEMHQFSEILGAQDLAFEEGLGTFYGYTHCDPQGYNEDERVLRERERSLHDRGRRRFPRRGSCASSRTKTSRSGHSGRRARSSQPARTEWTPLLLLLEGRARQGSAVQRVDVDGVHMYFWKHVNNDPAQALKMIEEMSGSMWSELRRRYPTYAVEQPRRRSSKRSRRRRTDSRRRPRAR